MTAPTTTQTTPDVEQLAIDALTADGFPYTVAQDALAALAAAGVTLAGPGMVAVPKVLLFSATYLIRFRSERSELCDLILGQLETVLDEGAFALIEHIDESQS